MIITKNVRLTRDEDAELRQALRNVLRWWGPEGNDSGRKRLEALARGERVDVQQLAEVQEYLLDLRDWATNDIDTYTPGIDSSATTPFGDVATMSLTIVESRVDALRDITAAEVALAEVIIEALGTVAP